MTEDIPLRRGGSGSKRQPTTDAEYRDAMNKLAAKAGK